MTVIREYLWIVIVGTIFGFIYAFGIGANDVANAFASTVSSGSLTLKQAVIVAGIFEFCGALFLGAAVTSTIRSKIFDPDLYADEPEILMLGFMTSIMTATFMLLTATHLELPVSTTHTIVGTLIGFSIVAKGFDSIEWDIVNKIFMSWAISPLVSGIASFGFFFTIRHVVLEAENPFERAFWSFPFIITATIGIDLFYVLYKGMNNLDFSDKLTLKNVLPSSFGFGLFCGFLWIVWIGPICKRRAIAHMAEMTNNKQVVVKSEDADKQGDMNVDEYSDYSAEDNAPESGCCVPRVPGTERIEGKVFAVSYVDGKRVEDDNEEYNLNKKDQDSEEKAPAKKSLLERFGDATYNQDLREQSFHDSKRAEEIWDDAVKYDPETERLFTYLQVFTACLNSFAHGANDVSNAIAPVSGLINLYQTAEVSSKSPVQKWVLAYGGIGLVLGLLLYGYKVMKSLGYKMTALSPSRGACAELAASLFVVTASYMEIPVSSTQSIVGAVAGVGLVGGVNNIQWLFFLKVCLGWVSVFFTAVFCSAGLFALLSCSPTIMDPLNLPPSED